MTLFISTTQFGTITFQLRQGKTALAVYNHSSKNHKTEDATKHLEKFLRLHKIFLPRKDFANFKNKLTRVSVDVTPGGSFVGTRVGVSIALALGYTLGIKVIPTKIKAAKHTAHV